MTIGTIIAFAVGWAFILMTVAVFGVLIWGLVTGVPRDIADWYRFGLYKVFPHRTLAWCTGIVGGGLIIWLWDAPGAQYGRGDLVIGALFIGAGVGHVLDQILEWKFATREENDQ